MAFSLYEINSQIEQAWGAAVDPDTGEIINEEAMQAFSELSMARDEKIENIALAYKNTCAEAEALKAEKLALQKRQASAEKKAEWLKQYLSQYMESGEKYKSAKVSIGWRKSESVQVDDTFLLPDEYLIFTVAPDKNALKKALKAGEPMIGGARLVTTNNIQIK
jgi:hypothetical protein